jgi:RNA polymerase sigma-70 factor (ECF subfamily)
MGVEQGNSAASFHSTVWSLVLGARVDRVALENLLRGYWSPVYAFIRRQGYSGHDASDLTQEFLAQVVLGRDLIGRADPDRGRFRSFLKQALRNFLIDQHRLGKHHKGKAQRHAPGTPRAQAVMSDPHQGHGVPVKSLDETDSPAAPAVVEDTAGTFDRAWAATVIEITVNRLEEACMADGMDAHWTAFELNVLGPALRKTRPLAMDDLAKTVGAIDAMQASNMLQTVKRRFRRTLREVVAETVGDPELVDQELDELRGHFYTGR